MSRSLAANAGSLDSLNVRTPCGRGLWARHTRSTELGLVPTAAAMALALQWVASCGGSVGVSSTTRSIVACARGGMRGGRVLSRSSPGTPSAANRACQRQTHGLDLPVRRTISPVRRAQDDLGPPHVLLRAVPVRHDRLQTGAVGGTHLDADTFAHPRQVGTRMAVGNLLSDAIH